MLRYDQRGHGGTRRAGRPLRVRHAARRRARPDGCAVDQEGAFRRPVHGRRDRARPRRAPSRPLRPHHRLRLALPVDAAVEPAMGGAHRDCAEARASRRWSSRRCRAGSRPRPWRRTRRISTRCAPCSAPRRSTASSAAPRRWPTTTTPRPSPRVKRPVLFLCGEKDAPAPAMRKLHEKLPRLALCRASRRRPYFQPGPAGGVHQGDPRFHRRRADKRKPALIWRKSPAAPAMPFAG